MSGVLRNMFKVMFKVSEEEARGEAAGQRGVKAHRWHQREDASQAVLRDRFATSPFKDLRARAEKRGGILDDLPRCFKRPKCTNKTDLYLDNYFRTLDAELQPSIKLRER